MTRRRTLLTGALTGSLILGLGLAAPAPDQSADDRLANQADRISVGVHHGPLTASEAARLEREQSRIAGEEQQFKSDGRLSGWRGRRLCRDENRASRDIWRLKHNARKQPDTK